MKDKVVSYHTNNINISVSKLDNQYVLVVEEKGNGVVEVLFNTLDKALEAFHENIEHETGVRA